MNKDEKLLTFSRQLLDESLDDLDEAILSRLRQNRQQAVKHATQTAEPLNQTSFLFPAWLAPISTGATFATVALVITLFGTQPLFQYVQDNDFMEDVQLLSAKEDLEFYQNIEFYLWLEDETS